MIHGPFERLRDQRHRARIIEVVEMFVTWDETLRVLDPSSCFNHFFDYVPDDGIVRGNSTMTADEVAQLAALSRLLSQAIDDTPHHLTQERYVASGWPQRIEPIAQRTLALFPEQGRFSENVEESEPGKPT